MKGLVIPAARSAVLPAVHGSGEGGGGGGGSNWDITGTLVSNASSVTRTYQSGTVYRGRPLGFPAGKGAPDITVNIERPGGGAAETLSTRFIYAAGSHEYYLAEQGATLSFSAGQTSGQLVRQAPRLEMAMFYHIVIAQGPEYLASGLDVATPIGPKTVTVGLKLTNLTNDTIYDTIEFDITLSGTATMRSGSDDFQWSGAWEELTVTKS